MKKKHLREEIKQLELTLAEEINTNEELERDNSNQMRALGMIARAAVVASALLAVRFVVSPRPFRFL